MAAVSKTERLEEFFRRLRALPPAGTFEEAWQQIHETLNQVEEELSGIPNHPANWQTDGRLYPPQLDREYPVTGHPLVRRFRSVAHNTLIGANGAMQVRRVKLDPLQGEVLFSKAGTDEKEVMDL